MTVTVTDGGGGSSKDAIAPSLTYAAYDIECDSFCRFIHQLIERKSEGPTLS